MTVSTRPHPQAVRALPTGGLRDYIVRLAAAHGVAYAESPTDKLAATITRLSDDDVQLDDIECLLLALRRASVISRAEMIELMGNYLDEAHV